MRAAATNSGKTQAAQRTKRQMLPQSVRFNVLRRDNFTCQYCGRSSPDVVLHVDHRTPVSLGGSDTEDNLVSACQDCNLGKGVRLLDQGFSGTKKGPAGVLQPSYVGLFGLRYLDGKLRYQFYVDRELPDGRYVVSLFSWFSGAVAEQDTWTRDVLACGDCEYFTDETSWNVQSTELLRLERWREEKRIAP